MPSGKGFKGLLFMMPIRHAIARSHITIMMVPSADHGKGTSQKALLSLVLMELHHDKGLAGKVKGLVRFMGRVGDDDDDCVRVLLNLEEQCDAIDVTMHKQRKTHGFDVR